MTETAVPAVVTACKFPALLMFNFFFFSSLKKDFLFSIPHEKF